MSYLLDTNICIALLKDSDSLLAKKIKAYPPNKFFLCSVVKAELLYGARKSNRVSDNLATLQIFFRQFESIPFDDKATEFYSISRTLLEKTGTPVGANDLLIASIAQANQLTVITRNRSEFLRIPALQVEIW